MVSGYEVSIDDVINCVKMNFRIFQKSISEKVLHCLFANVTKYVVSYDKYDVTLSYLIINVEMFIQIKVGF